jgi:iron complex outermembrane recepter protein
MLGSPAIAATAVLTNMGLMLPSAAVADQGTAPQSLLEEIVVTAQKRDSTVDKTPISITAITGADLQNRGITDFSAVAAETPGVSMKTNGPGQTEFEMRGMTSGGGSSPTVGFYLDDVPMTSPAAAQNGKVVIDPSPYDLNRIEVLRGPQGTLYGSGSMGGTIKLVTNQPQLSLFEASAQPILSGTDSGGFNHNENVMFNLPLITDQLALRIVGSAADTSGWIDRKVLSDFPTPTNGGGTRGNVLAEPVLANYEGSNAERLRGVRVTLAWKPIDNLTITPSIFYQRITQDGPSNFDSLPGTLARYQPFNIAEPYSDSITLNSLTVNYRLDAFDVTSVTSYWHRVSKKVQDGSENFENSLDGFPNSGTFYGAAGTGPIFGTETDPTKQFSEEIRAASTHGGALDWVGGIFYSNFKSNWEFSVSAPNPPAFFQTLNNVWNVQNPTTITQKAVFGEATYALTDRFNVTAGLRWYSFATDYRGIEYGFGEPSGDNTPTQSTVSQSNSGVNPKFNFSYQLNDNALLYATATKGFRPCGGSMALPLGSSGVGACIQAGLQALGYNGAAPLSYGPDSLWSYELGEKAKLLDARLRVNASAYLENWKNIQLLELPCNYPFFDDGKSAHIYGGELEIQALLSARLIAVASVGYTHSTIAEASHGYAVGDRLPDVPTETASIMLNYHTRLTGGYEFVARAENVFTGKRVDLTFPLGVPDTQTRLPSYDLTNLRAGITSKNGWTASLFANNVFNKQVARKYHPAHTGQRFLQPRRHEPALDYRC